jgi:hypothetical protein
MPEIVMFVVVALPVSERFANAGDEPIAMSWGRLKLMMFGALEATVIWFGVPWIWKVEVVKPLIVIAPEPVPVIVITFGDDVDTVTVPAPTIEVVEFERPLMAVMPLPVFAGVQKLPFHVRT